MVLEMYLWVAVDYLSCPGGGGGGCSKLTLCYRSRKFSVKQADVLSINLSSDLFSGQMHSL